MPVTKISNQVEAEAFIEIGDSQFPSNRALSNYRFPSSEMRETQRTGDQVSSKGLDVIDSIRSTGLRRCDAWRYR